jgi:hypothetical protein
MTAEILNNNINAIQCLQKDLGIKLNTALTLGISNKDCLEKDNMLITAILRALYNAKAGEDNCLTDDELCNLMQMAYSILNVNCC